MPKLFRSAPIGALLSLLLFVTAQSSSAATYTVTNINDSGEGSLRAAVMAANATPDNDTIEFDLSGCPCTVTLTTGELSITNNGSLTIDGPGADHLTLSGTDSSRLFFINSGGIVVINGITLTAGNGQGVFPGPGGSILNLGSLVLNESIASANSATLGGAIHNSVASTITLNSTTVSNNTATESGGGISNSGTLTLANSIVSSNSAGASGGGIRNSGTLTVSNSTVNANSAVTWGGGVFCFGGTFTLTDSFVINNSAPQAAGGISNSNGPLTIVRSTISGNTSLGSPGDGGGLRNGAGLATVKDSTIIGNSATYGGGGIFQASDSGGTVVLTNSTVRDNSTNGFGGGIYSWGIATLSNSTVSGNSSGQGGGIHAGFTATLSLANSTVSDNTATGLNGGGGVSFTSSGMAVAGNSLIAGNSAAVNPDFRGLAFSQGYNLIGNGEGAQGFNSAGDQVGPPGAPTDPMLGELADNGGPTFTHALLPGSPAIDAGDPGYAGPLTTDQRGAGFVRVYSGRIDIGALELQPPPACPFPQGDWKSNPVWPVDGLILGVENYTNAELLAILNTPVGRGKNADASIILAYQLIAAKLNIANGADGTSVIGTIAEADAILGGFAGRLPFGVSPSSPTGKLMTGYGKILDIFNNGTTTTGCSL